MKPTLNPTADFSFLRTFVFASLVILSGMSLTMGQSCSPPPSGLLSWWSGELNGLDSAGTNTGTFPFGIAYATGKVGQAFDFNGANNVVVADQPSLNPTNAITIECWVYPRALTTSFAQDLVSKDGEFSGPRQYLLTMGPPPGLDNGTGGFRAHVGVPGGLFYFIDGTTQAQTNTWYHVAMTYDGATLKLFVNGNLDAQLPVTGAIITSSEPIRLGGGAPGNDPAYFFNGLLDEVSLFGRALSQSEIQAIYTAGSAGKCTPTLPPTITQQPQNLIVNANTSADFPVIATGSPTLRFQWFFQNNPLPGETNALLTINNSLPVNQGTYFVTVSNDFGYAISSNATLTVLTFPPVITRQPTNTAVIVGNAATLSVQATGSVALAYQWLSNGIPMLGRTSTSLAFQSAQLSNAANYSVIVTNPYGAVTSSVAVLTVNPIPPCVAVHDGLVSWWKGENNALDNWDSNNGNHLINSYTAGKVGRAFNLTFIAVNDSPSLRVTNGLTLEAWINPSTLSGTRVLMAKYEYPVNQPSGIQSAYLLGTTNNGALFFTLTPNGSVRTNTTLLTTNLIPLNVWTHVAATYDGSVMRLYLNGTQVGQTNYTGKIFPGSAPLGIGGFQTTPPSTSSAWQYSGIMDEVSLYNRALSVAEIQSIVTADLTGKCAAPPVITQQPQDQIVPLGEDVKFSVGVSGSRPLAYQWYFNGAATRFTNQRIIGSTNNALLLEKVTANNAGFYFVTVSNAVGTNVTALAQLSTISAPSCTDILPGLISWWTADTNTFDVMGLNNIASYSPGTYPIGKVGSAFTFNGINSRVSINTTTLNFTNRQNFSIELWIKATPTNSTYALVPLIEKRDGPSTFGIGYSLLLDGGRLACALGAIDSIGKTTNTIFTSAGPDLRDGMFHHVAVTLDRTNTSGGVLYVDGSPVMVFNPRPYTNSLATQLPLYIGAPSSTVSNSFYTGLIDEPAIYNRALSPQEILAIRTAGASGRCKSPPIIITQPIGATLNAGSNYTLSVVASGTPAPRYQWRRNTAPIANATNSILNLTNATAATAGSYSVIVSNGIGSVTSSNAIVTVITNRQPTVLSGTTTVNEDSFLEFSLTGFDPDGNDLTYTVTSFPTNGTLTGTGRFWTYRPAHDFNGLDSLTFKVNDGFVDSLPGTIVFVVKPVNDPPSATSQLVTTDEDTAVDIILEGSDVDGDKLTFEIVQLPVHGILTGNGPKRIYTPAQDYFGTDYFTFITRDPSNAVSQVAAVSITINPVNDAPVARIVLSPLDQLPGETNTVLIAPACCDALLTLDASQSTDVDSPVLSYAWLDGTNILSTEAIFTNRFGPGVHEFTLVVSDGALESTEALTVEIIKTEEAVLHLQTLVQDAFLQRSEKAALNNWLSVTVKALEHCNVDQAVMFLERFEARVTERITPTYPKLGEKWNTISSAIRAVAGYCDPAHRPGAGNGNQKSKSEQAPADRTAASETRSAKAAQK